jgi:hypothetical protein
MNWKAPLIALLSAVSLPVLGATAGPAAPNFTRTTPHGCSIDY